MTTTAVKVMDLDTNPAQRSLKSMRKELRELRDELFNLEEGTEEYARTMLEAANIQHEMREQMEFMNASAMDTGQILENTVKVTGGLIAGFQAVQGAMQLFGVENENVIEAMSRLQGVMAITQALPAIDEAKDAFGRLYKNIKIATASMTPLKKSMLSVGGWVAGIAALGVAFVKLKERIDGTSTALREREEAQKGFNAELERELTIREKAGFSEEENLHFQIAQYEVRNKKLEETNKQLKEQNDSVSKASENAQSAAGAFGGATAAAAAFSGAEQSMNINTGANTKLIKENTKEVEENKTKIKELEDELAILVEARKLAAERTKKDTEEKDKNTTAVKNNALSLEELNKQTADWLKSQMNEGDYVDRLIEKENELIARRKEEQELRDLEKEDDDYEAPEIKSKPEGISEAINASALALSDFSDNPAWGEILSKIAILTANWDELHTNIKKGGKEAFSAYAQMAAVGFGAVGALLSGLAAEQDATTREGFEQQKKLQASAAAMSMFSGIASAWASSMQLGPIAGPIIGSILSAFMLATGIAQINKIRNESFGSGGAGGSASAVPNTAAVTSFTAPVQYTQDVNGTNIEGAIRNQKVYVTETDITNTQRKVDVVENEARF